MRDDNKRWPVARWMNENTARFFRRMPLTEFLGTLPVWMLCDVIHEESSPDPDLSPAMYLAILHLSLWSERSGGEVELSNAELGVARENLRLAADLELNRRLGMVRYSVRSPDRLLRGGRLDVETNPAILDVLRPPLPPVDDPDWEEQFVRAAEVAIRSGWGVPSALREYLDRTKPRP